MLPVSYLIELAKLHIVTSYILGMKKEYSVKRLNIIIVLILLCIDTFRRINTGYFTEYKYDTYITGIIAISVILFSFRKMRNIFKIAGCYLIICFIDMLIAGMFITVFSVDAIMLMESYTYSIVINGVGILLLIGISFLRKNVNLNINMDYINWKEGLLVIICLIGGGFYIAPIQLFSNNYGKVLAVGANISGIIIVVVSGLLILRGNSIRHLKKEQMMQERVIAAQQEYYLKRLEQESNTRKFRHDINQHLGMILYYANKDMYDKLKEYIQQLANELKYINEQSDINTGLDIVNIILADLVSIYQNVEIRWTGIIPQDINITNKDLVGLFSNLLKNAFEAATKCSSNRYVDVCTSYFDGQIYISVENSYNVKPERKEGSFFTSKNDKEEHGFGIQIIEDLVWRYKGQIIYTNEGKYFKVEITFINIGD